MCAPHVCMHARKRLYISCRQASKPWTPACCNRCGDVQRPQRRLYKHMCAALLLARLNKRQHAQVYTFASRSPGREAGQARGQVSLSFGVLLTRLTTRSLIHQQPWLKPGKQHTKPASIYMHELEMILRGHQCRTHHTTARLRQSLIGMPAQPTPPLTCPL